MQRRHPIHLLLVALLAWAPARLSHAQAPRGFRPAAFTPGSWSGLEDLPEGPFRERLESLPETSRGRALGWLRRLHFTAADLGSLRADDTGGIYFTDPAPPPPPADAADSTPGSPTTASAGTTVPVSPFPASLVFHSRPGAPNVLFLNFAGENVTGTLWNSSLGRTVIPALPFSSDSDTTTFSAAEQTAIRRIWQRVAEDFAPFQVDVTTERPGAFNNRTAHVLVTRNTDADGEPNPASTSGGVAYVDVFGRNGYASYRPAWVYANNLGNAESYIAEAASHEAGHNLGLGHDGIVDGPEYYSGHGSGEISWGPIMGTPYGRNVSQWSRGDYRLANNPQDDLALIATKLSYRVDDHGNTPGTATPVVSGPDGRVASGTPADDPEGTDPANRGVLERNTDVDVFSLVTGAGRVVLEVQPWRMTDTLTRGGNADLALELRDAAGRTVATSDPADRTAARIEADVAEGVYHLHIRGAGTGDPLATQPTGYPAYGSLGQYFLTGQLVPTGFSIPPVAELQAEDLTRNGLAEWEFTVTYSDDGAIDAGTLDDDDLRVTGPGGYDRPARLIGFNPSGNGSPRVATYAAPAPDGVAWSGSDNGSYAITLRPDQVTDTAGTAAVAGTLGGFGVAIPTAIYAASLDTDPGWNLEGRWEYGAPAYPGAGPTRGRTGDRILAYNLSGNYANRLPNTWATTPAINASGAAALTLRFQRWLRLRNADTATIQVSTNGIDWTDLWRTRSTVSDTSWREVQIALPSWTDGTPALFLRWGLASGPAQNDIGWNLDDIEVLSGGTLDTTAPVAVLGASDVTLAGAPTHTFTVTYSDDTAVAVATIGPEDLQVLGPDGGLLAVTLEGVDPAGDGTPRMATYSVAAPGGGWDPADNGVYEVTLLEAEVADVANNAVAGGVLGSFVAAMTGDPVFRELTVTLNRPDWGAVTPAGGRFPDGTVVELHAAPTTYYRFDRWTGDGAGSTANPLVLTLLADAAVGAEFSEVLTTNRPTPLWWLAAAGVEGDFESAVEQIGANGFALWESYVAGLDPNDPESRLTLGIEPGNGPGTVVLRWTPVEGRRYTVLGTSDPGGPFLPVEGASDLPATDGRVILPASPTATPRLYRLQVVKP